MSYQFFKPNNFQIEFPKQFNLNNESITMLNLPSWSGKWEPIIIFFKDSIDTETHSKLFKLYSYFNMVSDTPITEPFIFYIHLKNKDEIYKTWEILVNGINNLTFGTCSSECHKEDVNECSIEFDVFNCKLI